MDMKNIVWIFVLLFTVIFLTGCQDNSLVDCSVTPNNKLCDLIQTEDQVIQDSTSISTYASGVEFNIYKYDPQLRLPETYIDVTITDIMYSPLKKQVCFTYFIHDPQYPRATYYIILQEKTSLLTRQQITIFGGTSDFSGRSCVDVTDLTVDYRIVIGKDDSDNLNPIYGYIEGSAWIEFKDIHKNERKQVTIKSRSDSTPDTTRNIQYSSVNYSFQIEDKGQAITEVKLLLKDSFNNTVTTKTYAVDSIRSGSKITVVEGSFDFLAPNVDYNVEVHVSGHDGVDDFTDEFLFSIYCTSARFLGQPDSDLVVSYHGLYGVIYDVEETENSVIISYVYSNDDIIQYSDTEEKLVLHMVLLSDTGENIVTYEMMTGDHQITIPKEFIGEYYKINIKDQREIEVFGIYLFGTKNPGPEICKGTDYYTLEFNRDSSNVTNIDIRVYVTGFAAPIEMFYNFDFRNSNIIDLYHDTSNVGSMTFEIIVTYMAYGKEYMVIVTDLV